MFRPVAPNVGDAWPVWRLVLDGHVSLTEIERHWHLEHVFDANEAMDVAADVAAARRGPPPG
ncbi:MAG: hypothetical protein KC457_03000 [Myxococcales bacterium]|nr:hypothetical protein [Myxococcales bacterium]